MTSPRSIVPAIALFAAVLGLDACSKDPKLSVDDLPAGASAPADAGSSAPFDESATPAPPDTASSPAPAASN